MGRKGSVSSTSKTSMPVSPKLPRTIPKSSSPSTAGWFSRSTSSPPILAATRMPASDRRKGVIWPLCAPSWALASAHAPLTIAGTASEPRFSSPRYGRRGRG